MGSLKIIAAFLLGLICTLVLPSLRNLPTDSLSTLALYLLLFLVGMGIGGRRETLEMLRRIRLPILLIPLLIASGSILASGLAAGLLPGLSFREGAAVGAGFGYYSLSSILITRISGEALGLIALLSNIFREIFALTATPLLVRHCGRLSGIAAAGATAMDTSLPVIVRFTGREYALIAVFSGLVLTLLTPILVTFILTAGA